MTKASHRPFPAAQWLIAIIESSRDAIISKDLNGIIQSWNKGAELIFGYTADEAIGMPVTMLMPADRVDEEPGILARIRRGQSIEHYETIRRRKDGTLIDISLTVSPISTRTATLWARQRSRGTSAIESRTSPSSRRWPPSSSRRATRS